MRAQTSCLAFIDQYIRSRPSFLSAAVATEEGQLLLFGIFGVYEKLSMGSQRALREALCRRQ